MFVFTLKVIELRAETNDTSTIVFKQPALKKVKYQAGQYLTLIFRINGRRYLRPYSFSSCPLTDTNLEITVKRVSGGVVSNHILDEIKPGDIVEAIQPLGNFILKPEENLTNVPIVLWGAGSGITPLISILKTALFQNPTRNITLVYGNRSSESVIFAQKIKDFEKLNPHFKSWHFLTKSVIDNNTANVVTGRINPQMVSKIMTEMHNSEQALHYVCGPAGLIGSIEKGLMALGITGANIYSENFEITRNESDFEDIITRHVTIVKNNIETNVEVVKGKSILEAGLDASIELEYSCQTGDCHICKASIIKGQVKTIGVEKHATELQSNECLLCCSFPLTNNVEIIIE